MSGETMKAAVLHAALDLRYEDVPIPEPGSDQVLIRVSVNGLCGSDIHFYEDGELGPYRVDEPYIPGHEASGVVIRPAADGTGPAAGTRVAIEPGVPCRRCEWCKSGRYNLCPDVLFMSAPPVNGTFAEYATVAADFAHPIPDRVGDEEAAFVEPVGVALQAAKRSGLRAGQTVVVLGAGPIGLVTVLVALAYGAAEVHVIDRLQLRLDLAASIGAGRVSNFERVDPVEAARESTGGRLYDVVFDTAGNSNACAITPELCRRGGVVTLVGWPEKRAVPFPIEEVLERELDVRGVNRYCNTFPSAIALLSNRQIDVSRLISHRYPFSDVLSAFEFASKHNPETIKIMIGTEKPE
jgi:L-iditol 2-dehydrogenase